MKNKFLYSCLLVTLAFSIPASAQNSKRKKKTVQTPTVSTTSTNADPNNLYLDGNQIVLGDYRQNRQTETSVEPTNEATNTENKTVGTEAKIQELKDRIKTLEAEKKADPDEKQKRLLLNLDILTRAETRAESLRKQLFEIIEKENSIKTRLEQIQYDARPETIERNVAMVGSLRPEELRDQRKKSLEIEQKNLDSLLTQIQTTRATLEANVGKADLMVEKIRLKLDKEIDDALTVDEENN